ncbi:hypothetical protein, partial [Escherichia coli]
MYVLKRFVTVIMAVVIVTNPSYAGTQTVEATRYETLYGYVLRKIINALNFGVVHNGVRQEIWLNGMSDVPSHIGYRTYLILSRWGVPQPAAPYCESYSGQYSYTDSTGNYGFSCNVLVKYVDGASFQNYDPSKQTTDITEFAIDTIWTKNGVEIDPNTTYIPKCLAQGFKLYVYSNGSLVNNTYPFEVQWGKNVTKLALNIDDVVYASGDEAIINYNWGVTPAYPFISAMNTNMYMEQIDSNIAMSYVKPDGTGAAVIVPNTK